MAAEQKKETRYNKAQLAAGLAAANLSLPAAALEQLWMYHQFLRSRNPELNLTRIHKFESMVRKHYVDCLLVSKILDSHNIDWRGPVLDIGSGPGFPGIPMALQHPEIAFVLAEGRQKRVEFLQQCVERLRLANTTVFGGRVHAGQNLGAATVITRAVEPMVDTLRHSIGNMQPGALLIFMKGPNCDDEFAAMRAYPGCKLLLDHRYTLPDSSDHRRLVVWQTGTAQEGLHNWIQSAANPVFKQCRQLLSSRGIRKSDLCLVSGTKIITEVLRRRPEICQYLLWDN